MESGSASQLAGARKGAEAKNRDVEAALWISELRLRQTDLNCASGFFALVRESEEKREWRKKQTAKSSAMRATRF